MNSTGDFSRYNNNKNHHCSPTLARKNGYNFSEKTPKKDKKWFFGNLFRRKKKESDSSTDENLYKNSSQKKRNKSDKRKKFTNRAGFDHVLVPTSQTRRDGCRYIDCRADSSNISVPKNIFFTNADVTTTSAPSRVSSEIFNCDEVDRSNNSLESPSVCSLGRKKGNVKARAEARRDTSKGEESSDDDSQISVFRSNECLSKCKDSSLSRKSRAARTQRYLLRRSKDEELRISPKAHLDFKNFNFRNNKSQLTDHSFVHRSSSSGLTIPSGYNKYTTVAGFTETSDKYAQTKCNIPNKTTARSISYDSNINNSTSSDVNGILYNNEVPLYQSFNRCAFKKYPPPPPPRDPRRLIATQPGDVRPMSFSFENCYKIKSDTNHNNLQFTLNDQTSIGITHPVSSNQKVSTATSKVNRLHRFKNNTEDQGAQNIYRFLTDKSPRSRKPICIQNEGEQSTWSQKTFNFWKQKDDEIKRTNYRNSTPNSPVIFTAQTHVTTNIFLPNDVTSEKADDLKCQSSLLKPVPLSKVDEPCKPKLTNLEDALDELEAIYKSLQLGDEDLLDRAEKREADAAKKMTKGFSNFCDSNFNFNTNFDSTCKKKTSKNSEPDIKTDDMAFRKLNRNRFNTNSDQQSTIASISYLLTSPVFNATSDELLAIKTKSDGPDVMLDDVVFRNVIHSNNTLKIADPQPPFGIPIGPITPAATSDYLHAMPLPIEKHVYGFKKIPDVVKDDLAYRNLRKDCNEGNSSPQKRINDSVNSIKTDNLKKKRAVRSLSANISNLICKRDDVIDHFSPQNLTEVADALEIARQILREKENRINATRQAFMSDGELKYRSFESISSGEQRGQLHDNDNEFKSFENVKNDHYSLTISNKERIDSKPPTPDRRMSRVSKECTPIPFSPSEEVDLKQLRKSTLSEFITEELNSIDQLNLNINSDKTNFDHETKHLKKENDIINCDHDNLCENLLQCIVVNNKLLAVNTEELDLCEQVSKIRMDPVLETVADVVLLPSDKSKVEINSISTELCSESDHDYVNIHSNGESEIEETKEAFIKSRNKDLLAGFQTMDESLINTNSDSSNRNNHQNVKQADKDGEKKSRIQYNRSCNAFSFCTPRMSNITCTNFKEVPRKQLVSELAPFNEHQMSEHAHVSNKGFSSTSEDPHSTRASRLRTTNNLLITKNRKEKNSHHLTNENDAERTAKKLDRDKSNKRKSNLNRSLNTEEVPQSNLSDQLTRRQRRRFFPPEVLQQAAKDSLLYNESSTPRTSNKKCNARTRMDHIPSSSDMIKSSPNNSYDSKSGQKGLKPSNLETNKKIYQIFSKREENENGQKPVKNRFVDASKRTDELTTSSQDVLGIEEEKLGNQTLVTNSSNASVSKAKRFAQILIEPISYGTQQFSILKKKEESSSIFPLPIVNTSAPISILKRKVSLDDFCVQTESPPTNTPVTFSPSVTDPSTSRKRQGILKKRRSLDESQVLRHRSCSPEVAASRNDGRSILKNQRRSSLEGILRNQSPESGLHGILKRRPSRQDDTIDLVINSPEPHGILKRRSGSSSSGSNTPSPHVSIATAVILAAAGGAEIVLETNESVKPILKKKSICDELLFESSEVPKPILKKKYSTDTDDCDEKPKKPILKNSKGSVEDRDSDSSYRHGYAKFEDSLECDVTAIRKQNSSRENSPKPRLSFSSTDFETLHNSIQSYTFRSDYDVNYSVSMSSSDHEQLIEPHHLSSCDVVENSENRARIGATISRNTKRQHARYQTQPNTCNESDASENCVQQSLAQNLLSSDFKLPSSFIPVTDFNNENTQSLVDLSNSSEGSSNIDNLLSSSLPNSTIDSGIFGKMSSDSAFQSLGDGLELENQGCSLIVLPDKPLEKNDPDKVKMRTLAEESKIVRSKLVSSGLNSFKHNISSELNKNKLAIRPKTVNDSKQVERVNIQEGLSDDSSNDEIKNERKRTLKYNIESQVNKGAYSKFRVPVLPVFNKSNDNSSNRLHSVLKPDSSEFVRDEGISSDDSHSGSEVESGINNETKDDTENEYKIDANSGNDVNLTSDGDSSGGREVRSIIGQADSSTQKRYNDRTNNASFIYKSKSQAVVSDDEEEAHVSGVRRSLTQSAMPQKIAELQAKLQQSGDTDWRKRITKLNNANEELTLLNAKNIYNEEVSEKTLAVRKVELDAASKRWRDRVEQSDAVNFSVAGRMQQEDSPSIPIHIPTLNKHVQRPKAKVFKGKEDGDTISDVTSLPISLEKNDTVASTKRGASLPGAGDTDADCEKLLIKSGRTVKIERADNITFTRFFESVERREKECDKDVTVADFDLISRQSEKLLVQKRTVKAQRRREATKNPVKALASRSDVLDEYTEVNTGFAGKEQHCLNIEKLAGSSNFAVEALAGLASKEDFSLISLKTTTSWNIIYPPYKDLMLLQIKGRRFVQTRLIEPAASSINDGDSYVLVTPNVVYNYIGAYANVIEQSRSTELANIIQQKSDLGCKTAKVITINCKKLNECLTADFDSFWKLLGATKDVTITPAGHPDEDEIYENSILTTNMVYEYKKGVLVPSEESWGSAPKIEILNSLSIFVFDFGSEMYVWNGKNSLIEKKKKALKLAEELWNEGYNYIEYGVNPLEISKNLGSREETIDVVLKHIVRPKWALFAKLTQHCETILFKEKFVDWPDYSRVIRSKDKTNNENVETKFDLKPCNVDEMETNCGEPDMVVDGYHLGRGMSYYDESTRRAFNFSTRSIVCWVILDYSHEKIASSSIGQFYDGNSYIVRWEYTANTTGRELSGKASKHAQSGRDLCLYFCWQGNNASVNEKGAAALLTIELDSENARQIRVLQGSEPPVFLNLFNGNMAVHLGKHEKRRIEDHRLYIGRGELESESFLIEVRCSMRSLRSRASFILVSCKTGKVTVWNGCQVTSQIKKNTREIAERILLSRLSEFGFTDDCEIFTLDIVEEGSESVEFLTVLGGEKRQFYNSLLKTDRVFNFTPKLFRLSSLSGKFEAKEVCCPHRSQHITSYPFVQSDIYAASQPALFLLDNKYEVWLWQGWWSEIENDYIVAHQTGPVPIRWQEERKVALQTSVEYCQKFMGSRVVPAYLVWAGLEPLAFTNLFPFWTDRDDITELNIRDGRKPGQIVEVNKELSLLSRSTYPLEQLLGRPLPDGVNPVHLENYLSPRDFFELMSMTVEEFQKLPTWKQTSVKKEKGLF